MQETSANESATERKPPIPPRRRLRLHPFRLLVVFVGSVAANLAVAMAVAQFGVACDESGDWYCAQSSWRWQHCWSVRGAVFSAYKDQCDGDDTPRPPPTWPFRTAGSKGSTVIDAYSFGVPFPCAAFAYANGKPSHKYDVFILGRRLIVPGYILWDRLLLAAVCYTAIFYLAGWSAVSARSLRRRRVGRCPRCGYQVQGISVCPECGLCQGSSWSQPPPAHGD